MSTKMNPKMNPKKQIPSRRYTDEFKVEAVRLMDAVGVTQASRRLSTAQANLYKWRDKAQAGELSLSNANVVPLRSGPNDLAAENDRLRRELANTKLDLEIVKKRQRSSRVSHGGVRLD